MHKDARIAVIGSKGVLGNSLIKVLRSNGYDNIIGCDLPEYDITNRVITESFFAKVRPDVIFFGAAVVAGIDYKRKHPAEMLQKNLEMVINVFGSAFASGCKSIINVSSALIYPDDMKMPYNEKYIDSIELDTIDAPYTVAKAVSLKLSQSYNAQYGTRYITVVPCNFFGPFATYTGDKAGVVPSLVWKFHKSKLKGSPFVDVWGTGNACRDILYSDDVAEGCIKIWESKTNLDMINIARGKEYKIKEIAEMVRAVVGYDGDIVFDTTKPEGKQHMLLNNERINSLGWSPRYELYEGIRKYYDWFCLNHCDCC